MGPEKIRERQNHNFRRLNNGVGRFLIECYQEEVQFGRISGSDKKTWRFNDKIALLDKRFQTSIF